MMLWNLYVKFSIVDFEQVNDGWGFFNFSDHQIKRKNLWRRS